MTRFLPFLSAASIAFGALAASAQVVPSGPFVGMRSEGFETQTSNAFTFCVEGRILGGTADACDPLWNQAHVTSEWNFHCMTLPQAGARFFGSAGGPAEISFDHPVTRFGGYFTTNAGVPDAEAEFYDGAGLLLARRRVTAPADCTWTWNGWSVSGGPGIRRVRIVGLNGYNGGGYVDIDGLEVDYGPFCEPPQAYCAAKVNSLGCTPSIGSIGTPSASTEDGFVVGASLVRNNERGLLLYGTNGPSATPFQGGLLCVNAPVSRSPILGSGGNPAPLVDCTGWYWIDINKFARGGMGGTPDPLLAAPGTTVHCQFWGRDQGLPPPNVASLSDGLTYTVCP